uniref:EF-hand domain-containing protein n=2 Tax=Micromonas TaxID=38832 RepID=A0A7S0IL12_MICPS
MGNCGSSGGSSDAAARDRYEAGQKQTAAKLTRLGCTRGTVSAVLKLYRQADTNRDGHVDLGEFARQFDIERRNPFLPRLVQLFDLSGDGQMSVFEYVVCLSQFGARRGRGDHIYFAWRLFDVDDDGSLTKDEFVRVLKSTYMRGGEHRRGGEKFNTDDRVGRGFSNFGGVGGFAKGIDSIIRDMDADGDGAIGIEEFTRLMKKYQHFMSPAFDLWQKLEALAGPCARVYAEVRAAGMLDELIDLAMCSSDTRHGDEPRALRADRADDESLFGGGAKRTKPREAPRRTTERDGVARGEPRVGKTGAKTEDVGMAVFRRKAAIEQRERRAGRPRGKYSESDEESDDDSDDEESDDESDDESDEESDDDRGSDEEGEGARKVEAVGAPSAAGRTQTQTQTQQSAKPRKGHSGGGPKEQGEPSAYQTEMRKRYNQFARFLGSYFASERVEQASVSALLRHDGAADFKDEEVVAFLDMMTRENKVMLSDGTVWII